MAASPEFIVVVTSQAIVRQRWCPRRNADPRGSDQLPNSPRRFRTLNGPYHLSSVGPAAGERQCPPLPTMRLSMWAPDCAVEREIARPIEPGCQRRSSSRTIILIRRRRRRLCTLTFCFKPAGYDNHRFRTRELSAQLRNMSGS